MRDRYSTAWHLCIGAKWAGIALIVTRSSRNRLSYLEYIERLSVNGTIVLPEVSRYVHSIGSAAGDDVLSLNDVKGLKPALPNCLLQQSLRPFLGKPQNKMSNFVLWNAFSPPLRACQRDFARLICLAIAETFLINLDWHVMEPCLPEEFVDSLLVESCSLKTFISYWSIVIVNQDNYNASIRRCSVKVFTLGYSSELLIMESRW